jgi:CheY-like chemotaxis protein
MSAAKLQPDRIQRHLKAHYEGLGLHARATPDGQSLLVSMSLSPAPFESIASPLTIERIIFVTVGSDLIKCLRPRPIFGLSLINVRGCKDVTSLESAIRRAWRERTRNLRAAKRWLSQIGIDATACQGASAIGFPLPGESPDTRILLQDRHSAILPSAGPLSGLHLASREQRVIDIKPDVDSSADLECLVAAQIDSSRRHAQGRDSANRQRSVMQRSGSAPTGGTARTRKTRRHQPKVLIVGPGLVEDAALRHELKRQGYRAATARSETEALLRLTQMTPDVVLSEYALGRSDGATLVAATHNLAGIEDIPVVLLDEIAHSSRREAARMVGAAGYVIVPTEKSGFVTRLGRLIDEPRKRRFTRYPGRLSARLQGLAVPCLATQVGRGGVFLATDADIDLHSAMQCELVLPELGRDLRFDGEVLYRSESQGSVQGLGLRFYEISPEDETALIGYLTWLERNCQSSPPPGAS